jgi:hypothetical protein
VEWQVEVRAVGRCAGSPQEAKTLGPHPAGVHPVWVGAGSGRAPGTCGDPRTRRPLAPRPRLTPCGRPDAGSTDRPTIPRPWSSQARSSRNDLRRFQDSVNSNHAGLDSAAD